MFWKSKTKNSGMYNTLSIPANLISWTQSGTNWNGILTEATMLANNIDYTRVMNVVPQWTNGTNSNGWVTTISRSSNDNNIYITLTRGGGGSQVDTSHFVTTDTQQTITGDKQFNANVEFNKVVVVHNGTNDDCSFAVQRDAQHANYVGFYNGNNRLGFVGKASANDTNFTVGSDTGNIKLISHADIDCNNKKLINVATPTNGTDGVNKAYVDSVAGGMWTKIGFQQNGHQNPNQTAIPQTFDFQNYDLSNGVFSFVVKAGISEHDFSFGFYGVNITSTESYSVLTNSIYVSDVDNSHGFKMKIERVTNQQIKLWFHDLKGNGFNVNYWGVLVKREGDLVSLT